VHHAGETAEQKEHRLNKPRTKDRESKACCCSCWSCLAWPHSAISMTPKHHFENVMVPYWWSPNLHFENMIIIIINVTA